MDYFSIFIQMLQAKGLTNNTIRSNWIQLQRTLADRTINMVISYLQFFHMYVHKDWDRTQIPFRKFDVFLPFVPSRTQVLRIDELCPISSGR